MARYKKEELTFSETARSRGKRENPEGTHGSHSAPNADSERQAKTTDDNQATTSGSSIIVTNAL